MLVENDAEHLLDRLAAAPAPSLEKWIHPGET